MPAAYRRTICLGQVQIPVSLFTVIQDNSIHFNQLHKDTKERIQTKKMCPHCDGEVKPEDIIRGFQYIKDHYVIISDEELEECKMEKDKTIQIIQFAALSEIDSLYFDKPYYVIPETGGEKAFELLRIAMLEDRNVAVAKTILVSKETLAVFVPTNEGILMRTLSYFDDIKEPPGYRRFQMNTDELKVFKELKNSLVKPFEPANYHDEYQMRIKEKVESKVLALDIVMENEDTPQLPLMEALRKSILDAKPAVKKPVKKKETHANKDKVEPNAVSHDLKK